MLLGDHQTSIDFNRRALRLSPLDPRIFFAHNGLAFANFFLGNYEDALKCAVEGLRHHPDYLNGLRAAIACHSKLGNVDASKEFLQKLFLLSPNERVSEARKRVRYRRDQDMARLEEAYRAAGMPE